MTGAEQILYLNSNKWCKNTERLNDVFISLGSHEVMMHMHYIIWVAENVYGIFGSTDYFIYIYDSGVLRFG